MAGTDFSIADVLAWARTKPADEPYDYTDGRRCAFAQFLVATGRDIGLSSNLRGRFPLIAEAANPISDENIRRFGPALAVQKTFGALVTRLEALCPDQIVTPSEWTKLDAYLTDIEMARA